MFSYELGRMRTRQSFAEVCKPPRKVWADVATITAHISFNVRAAEVFGGLRGHGRAVDDLGFQDPRTCRKCSWSGYYQRCRWMFVDEGWRSVESRLCLMSVTVPGSLRSMLRRNSMRLTGYWCFGNRWTEVLQEVVGQMRVLRFVNRTKLTASKGTACTPESIAIATTIDINCIAKG